MMLEDARERRLLLEAVDMLHRPFVWYVVCRFFRFPTDIFRSDCGCCEHIVPPYYYHPYGCSTILRRCFQCLAPRPITFLSRTKPEDPLPYWYRPHRSTMKQDLYLTSAYVFLTYIVFFSHSTQIGLYSNIPFAPPLHVRLAGLCSHTNSCPLAST